MPGILAAAAVAGAAAVASQGGKRSRCAVLGQDSLFLLRCGQDMGSGWGRLGRVARLFSRTLLLVHLIFSFCILARGPDGSVVQSKLRRRDRDALMPSASRKVSRRRPSRVDGGKARLAYGGVEVLYVENGSYLTTKAVLVQ